MFQQWLTAFAKRRQSAFYLESPENSHQTGLGRRDVEGCSAWTGNRFLLAVHLQNSYFWRSSKFLNMFVAEVQVRWCDSNGNHLFQRMSSTKAIKSSFMDQVSSFWDLYRRPSWCAKGNKIDRAPNPMETLTIKSPTTCSSWTMVRASRKVLSIS